MAKVPQNEHYIKRKRAQRKATYVAWRNMLARCYRPTHVSWDHYGGRGITVCDRWRPEVVGSRQAFINFCKDVTLRPTRDHSLDRVRVNEPYQPGNVRWATAEQQGSNKRGSLVVKHPVSGDYIPPAYLARELGISYQQLRYNMMQAGTWATKYAVGAGSGSDEHGEDNEQPVGQESVSPDASGGLDAGEDPGTDH